MKSHNVVQEFFGKENVHGSCVHLDEMHPYIEDGVEKMSLAHSHTLVSAYAKWKDKSGERKGINGKNFETRSKLNALNKAMCDMVRKEFGVEYNTGEKAKHKTVEQLKAQSELEKIEKKIEERTEYLDLIEQAGDKAFAKLSENIDKAKSIGVQQLQEEFRQHKQQTEDYVRSLEPTPTKKIKTIMGKEKEIPKTEEELARDREILAAQAVLKDKDELAKEKKRVQREREEIQIDRADLEKYVIDREAEYQQKTAAIRENYERQLAEQSAKHTQETAVLQAENHTLKDQIKQLIAEKARLVKSMAAAAAIRARTTLEKKRRENGEVTPYNVDAQMRVVQQLYPNAEPPLSPRQTIKPNKQTTIER